MNNFYIFLIFFIPITLFGSSREQDGLFDNGILGRGFVEKSKDSLRREEILAKIRDENVLSQSCLGCAQTRLNLSCDSLAYAAWNTIIFGTANFLKQYFVNKKIENSKKVSSEESFVHNPVIKNITEENFVCNPVIETIISVPDEIIPFLGGNVQFRSKLHHLRERFDSEHMAQNDGQFTFPYDEDKDLFGSKNYLIGDASGIVVKYTDKQFVRISYNQQQDSFQYSIKKIK